MDASARFPRSSNGPLRKLGAPAPLLVQHPNAVVVLPTLPSIQDLIQTNDWPCRVILVTDPEQKKDAYAASHIAIAASGTVALELALGFRYSVTALNNAHRFSLPNSE